MLISLGLIVFVASFAFLNDHERPTFVATSEGVAGLGVRLPTWYLSRNAFLVANLAPVCLMTLAGLLLLPLVAPTGVGLLVFSISLNLAGSISDVISSMYVYLHPPCAYIKTDGQIHHPPGAASVAGWKRWFRSGVEWILVRLE